MSSLLPKKRDLFIFGSICLLWIFTTHFFAIEQNKLVLERIIGSQNAITNLSIIVMLDLLLTLGFSQSLIKKMAGENRSWGAKIAAYVPCILFFPVLTYLQITLFFQLPGYNFVLLTTLFGISSFICIMGGSFLLRKIIPEAEVRIELVLLFSLLLFLLSICFMVFHPSILIYSYSQPVDWKDFILTLAVTITLGGIGLLWQLFYRKKKKRT
ncbi:hypothetical protein LJC68_01070 [Bacteroidales bacterium OttesenSCG-928-B11]|nr:hypothetical protein [Bacteroidales bacterium OttesenSCG-928-B11]